MVSALHGSRFGGPSSFEKDGVCFGWQAIVDLLKREVQRKEKNELPRYASLVV